MKRLMMVMTGLLVSIQALAQSAPGPDVDVVKTGTDLVAAIEAKNIGLIVAFAVLIVVFLLKRYVWKSVNKKYLVWIAVVIGALTGASAALIQDSTDWLSAILSGVGLGFMAAGQWSATKVGKKDGEEK